MKIALAQLNYTVGDLDANKFKIINSIYDARGKNAEIVVFSEFAISGTQCYDMFGKLPFLEACEEALVEIASHCDDISVLVGLPLLHGTDVISAVAFIENRRIVKFIGKERITSRDELGFISPSKGFEYINVCGRKVAVVVGEDVFTLKEQGENSDFIIVLRAQKYERAIIEKRYEYTRLFSSRTGKHIAFINHLGGQSDIVYDGSSCVYNSDGEAVAFLKSFEEDMVVIDPETAPVVEQPEQNKTRNVYNAIKLGLRDYFTKNGFSKACVGLSGGIDSAVVTALAAEVLGSENVRVLMMPSEFSTEHSVKDALEMADNLGIEYDVIPISESYKAITESMKPVLGGTRFDTTEENIQSRIRTVMLMALSNKFGHILLNTGNKSEAAVGYSTLYGDSAGAIAIIGDLYKSEVYDLARYINRNGEVIPENILSKEPSAELRPDQKDSDSLPPYDVLDAILYRFVEEGQTYEDLINAGFDNGTVHFVLDKIKATEYKRRQEPPVLRLSSKPFGTGFRLPLVTKFKF